MRNFAHFSAVALLLATAAPAIAADPETDQLICDLAGQCGADGAETAPPAAAPSATSSAAPGAPRTGATRGFTFKRQAPAGGITPAAEPSQQSASAAARPASPARVGISNLRLSFASGSATLTEADKVRLAKLAQVLGTPSLASRRARIEGHTDASGSAMRNRDLSRRRAQSVADFLVNSGIPAGRLEVVGYGSSQPLPGLPTDSPENRRVMAVLLN